MKKNLFAALIIAVTIVLGSQTFAADRPCLPGATGISACPAIDSGMCGRMDGALSIRQLAQTLDPAAVYADSIGALDNATLQTECLGKLITVGVTLVIAIREKPVGPTTSTCASLNFLVNLANLQLAILDYRRCTVEYADVPDTAILEQIDRQIATITGINSTLFFLQGVFGCLTATDS